VYPASFLDVAKRAMSPISERIEHKAAVPAAVSDRPLHEFERLHDRMEGRL
jgi:hypothetical protein